MMCKFFCVILLCVFLITGCGTADRALVLERDAADMSVKEQTAGREETADTKETKDQKKPEEEAGASVSGAEQRILVFVCGAVANPGVVELPADSRAADALAAAGGLLEEAQPDYVNLAARLEDAQKLYFPTKEEAKEMAQAENAAEVGKVNINTAGIEQLCTLPGIGESRAEDIVAYRQQNGDFEAEEDIMKVSGIKQSAYEKLKGKITVK